MNARLSKSPTCRSHRRFVSGSQECHFDLSKMTSTNASDSWPTQSQLVLRLCTELSALRANHALRMKRVDHIVQTSQIITQILAKLQALSTERSRTERAYHASFNFPTSDNIRASLLDPEALLRAQMAGTSISLADRPVSIVS
jgi:hypothetical protein